MNTGNSPGECEAGNSTYEENACTIISATDARERDRQIESSKNRKPQPQQQECIEKKKVFLSE